MFAHKRLFVLLVNIGRRETGPRFVALQTRTGNQAITTSSSSGVCQRGPIRLGSTATTGLGRRRGEKRRRRSAKRHSWLMAGPGTDLTRQDAG